MVEALAGDNRGDSPLSPSARPRVHSIKFDAPTDDWVESLVELMSRAGFTKAGRSEVVRVALGELRRQLAGRNPTDTVRFFLDRDAERRLARLGPEDSGDTP